MPEIEAFDPAAFEAYKKANAAPAATAPAPPIEDFDPQAFAAFKKAQSKGTDEGQEMSAENLGRQAITGVPILGGLGNKLDAYIDALNIPRISSPTASQASTHEQRYAENLARSEARDAAFNQAHPDEAQLARLGGGVLGTLPATLLAPEALGISAPFGLTGASGLGARMLAGGTSGAGMSAADAVARGEPITAATLWGGGIGGAIPFGSVATGGVLRALTHPAIASAAGALPKAAGMYAGMQAGDVAGGMAGHAVGEAVSPLVEHAATWLLSRIRAALPTVARAGKPVAYPLAQQLGTQDQSPQAPYGAQ